MEEKRFPGLFLLLLLTSKAESNQTTLNLHSWIIWVLKQIQSRATAVKQLFANCLIMPFIIGLCQSADIPLCRWKDSHGVAPGCRSEAPPCRSLHTPSWAPARGVIPIRTPPPALLLLCQVGLLHPPWKEEMPANVTARHKLPHRGRMTADS